MKTLPFYTLLFFLVIGIISCKKEFPNGPLLVKDLSVGDCKSKGSISNIFDPEYITLKTTDDYYILFEHINSIFNCDPGEITVSTNMSGDTMIINENETKAGADCICSYDITFKIGPLQHGTYPLKFNKGGLIFKEFVLDFTSSTIFFTSCEQSFSDKIWVYYNETQCSNPWPIDASLSTESKVQDYLNTNGIQILDTKIITYHSGPFCEACHCSTGRKIFVLILKSDFENIQKLGFIK
jgi:hypothetical protein